MKKNNKGFTLMEMLIVVAIIAVLVAIAIPTFTASLEKSREATDIANIRSAYAEATTKALTSDNGEGEADTVAMTQATSGWKETSETKIGSKYVLGTNVPNVQKGDVITVKIAADGTVTFTKK